MEAKDGRSRVVIEAVSPQIDGGRFPVKRILGDEVTVEADLFTDSHDVIRGVLKFRHRLETEWTEKALEPVVNDRWRATFTVDHLGCYFFTVQGWVDPLGTWRRDLEQKFKAGLDIKVELLGGLSLVQAALSRSAKADVPQLRTASESLAAENALPDAAKVAVALDPGLARLVERYTERAHATAFHPELEIVVDPVRAEFGTWFEMFPRSASPEPDRPGTFRDCQRWLPQLVELGFDVLYLPPIHPIGRAFRKGRNNSVSSVTGDPGSPWAIGAVEGGHKDIHPELGTLDEFRELVMRARDQGIEVALDIALQCAPDHPYAREHPEWFRKRPDGSIQYAENPPKKYQDIYPLDFESAHWQELWQELKSIFEFWVEQGVRIFRVDNPHTKPFRFWEWCLGELKRTHPELIFLSEAFTRPKVMKYLAKLGFTQSYNYFPWRNTKHELIQYFTELTGAELKEFFRPNLWTNTPDILTQYLQFGGVPAFMIRVVLAGTLGASYGMYGTAFLAGENQPREPGSEEYLNSEKYEIRHWDLDTSTSLSALVARVNRIRRENPALQRNGELRFHPVDNEQLIAYSKRVLGGEDSILVVVNLDPRHTQRGWVTLPLSEWDLGSHDTYQLHELITDARFLWSGERNYVELDPDFVPAHIFRLRRYVRTEQDFDYFM